MLFSVKILQNALIAHGIYHMKIYCPEVAVKAAPGQFLHIRCSDTPSPLLRRPVSIAGVNEEDGTVEIIYRVVGEGTRLMSQKKAGEIIDILGPLGRGFPLPPGAANPVLIGGGVGVAPLLYLARKIAGRRATAKTEDTAGDGAENNGNISSHAWSCGPVKDRCGSLSGPCRFGVAFIGFSTAGEVFGEEFLRSCGFKVFLTTDDGTAGQKGVPTEVFENYIKAHEMPGQSSTHPQSGIIYACGPKPLLAKVKDIAAREKIPAYLSLEERMACGVGACLGCAVKSAREGYKKVCRDGPVFESGEIHL